MLLCVLGSVCLSYTLCTVMCVRECLYVLCVTGVGFRWRIVGDMTGWLDSSVVEGSHGQRKALGSGSGRTTIFHLLQMYLYVLLCVLGSVCMSYTLCTVMCVRECLYVLCVMYCYVC